MTLGSLLKKVNKNKNIVKAYNFSISSLRHQHVISMIIILIQLFFIISEADDHQGEGTITTLPDGKTICVHLHPEYSIHQVLCFDYFTAHLFYCRILYILLLNK